MKDKRKICVVTGSRAEYGLLYWLLKEIDCSTELQLQIIVTGMHLSPEFGLTYTQIEDDGFSIDRKVEMLLSSDSPVGVSKSIGLAQIGFADALHELQPDMMVVLGDRFEILAAVTSALVARIPVAHIHGGETTQGAIDESIRHSISKMSHLHFTAAKEYRRRVVQLGEHPDTVFNVGALGLDNIKRLQLLHREEFEKSIGFKLGERNLLVTFHPVTLEQDTAKQQFQELLKALDSLVNTKLIFTRPNADTDGRVIVQMIDDYLSMNPQKGKAFDSLGQIRYLSALQYVDGVVGNSSSGLIEAPSFQIGTINIGDRQKGRLRARSVIDCKPEEQAIKNAICKLYSEDFQDLLKTTQNPYAGERVAEKIVEAIKRFPLSQAPKKEFYDIGFSIRNSL